MTVLESPSPDYYAELEVAPAATAEMVRAAYMTLAKRYHPDRNPTYAARQRMQRLNDAYAVLGNEAKRAVYDAARTQQMEAFAAASARYTAAEGMSGSRLLGSRPRLRRYAACTGGAIAVILVLCAVLLGVRGLDSETAHGDAASTATGRIVRDQITAGAPPAVPLRAIDVIAAAARNAGFGEVDALRDASRGVTAADRGWSFRVLGCTVLAGEYDTPDRAQAAIAYWRGNGHADEVDAGNLVLGVSGCPDAAALANAIDGLRAIVAAGGAATTR